MQIRFVAGFGPIVRDLAASRAFWAVDLRLPLAEAAPNYWATDNLGGVQAFALWPLDQAAESCFGSAPWPPELPVPQAWIEFDVASPEAVAEAIAELEVAGHSVLREAREEPWGQTTARLLSPEGLLTGITYTPWMHPPDEPDTPGAGSRQTA